MQNIDFLPARYHEQSENRKSQIWRLGVIALFGGSILSAAVFQFGLRRIAVAQLATVEASYDVAKDSRERLDELNRQIALTRDNVELHTYLNHPWPQTQVLAAIAGNVTESITLSEIHQVRASASRRRKPAQGDFGQQPAQTSAVTPSRRDLKILRELCDTLPIVIHLTGVTTNASDLHAFIEKLHADRLFAKAELNSLENVESGDVETVSRFRARVILAPGYGQPDGPRGPTEAMAGIQEELR